MDWTAVLSIGLFLLALAGIAVWSEAALRAERGVGEAQLAARRALLATEQRRCSTLARPDAPGRE